MDDIDKRINEVVDKDFLVADTSPELNWDAGRRYSCSNARTCAGVPSPTIAEIEKCNKFLDSLKK